MISFMTIVVVIGTYLYTVHATSYVYNGHTYALTPYATDWLTAAQIASSSGGYLVTVNDASEQLFLNTTFLSAQTSAMYWIGFVRDCPTCTTFHWMNGETLTFTNWYPGQPDNSYGGSEWYAVMNWAATPPGNPPYYPSYGRWNDFQLVDRVYGAVYGIIEFNSENVNTATLFNRSYVSGPVTALTFDQPPNTTELAAGGSAYTWQNTYRGQSGVATFNGVNQFINLFTYNDGEQSLPRIYGGSLSFEARFMYTAFGTAGGTLDLCGANGIGNYYAPGSYQNGTGATDNEISVGISSNVGTPSQFQIYNANPPVEQLSNVNSVFVAQLNTWIHMVITTSALAPLNDTTSNNSAVLTMYINGIYQSSTIGYLPTFIIRPHAYFGQGCWSLLPDRWPIYGNMTMIGSLDDLYYYQYGLSQEVVSVHYLLPRPPQFENVFATDPRLQPLINNINESFNYGWSLHSRNRSGLIVLSAASSDYVDLNSYYGENAIGTFIPLIGGPGYVWNNKIESGWTLELLFMANTQISSSKIFSCGNGGPLSANRDNIEVGWSEDGNDLVVFISNSLSQRQVEMTAVANMQLNTYYLVMIVTSPQTNTLSACVNGYLANNVSNAVMPSSVLRSQCYLGKSDLNDPFGDWAVDSIRTYDYQLPESIILELAVLLNIYPLYDAYVNTISESTVISNLSTTIALYGAYLNNIQQITLQLNQTLIVYAPNMPSYQFSPSSSTSENSLNVISINFTVPAISGQGYLSITIVTPNQTLVLLNWLYVADLECSGLIISGSCLTCPAGAFCPGGGRSWPVPGYWSSDEHSAPTRCSVFEACPGSLEATSTPSSPDPILLTSGARNTERCAEGYNGEFCVTCTNGFYPDQSVCRYCGSTDSSARHELAGYVIAALIIFGIITLGVALLPSPSLAVMVRTIVVCQQLVLIGRIGTQSLPSSAAGLYEFFSAASIINFDVNMFKPGCLVAYLSFLDIYFVTLIVVIIASVAFVLASMIRATIMTYHHSHNTATPWLQMITSPDYDDVVAATPAIANKSTFWRNAFVSRLIHAQIILFVISYLRLTYNNIAAVHCVHVPDPDPESVPGTYVFRVQADLSTNCYTGSHQEAAIFIWPCLLLYSCGFPILMLVALYRTLQDRGGAKNVPSAVSKFAFLISLYRIECWWFTVPIMYKSFILSLSTALPDDIVIKIFATTFVFFVTAIVVSFFVPYAVPWRNIGSAVSTICTLLLSVIFLALLRGLNVTVYPSQQAVHTTSEQQSLLSLSYAVSLTYTYFYIAFCIFAITSVAAIVLLRRYNKYTVAINLPSIRVGNHPNSDVAMTSLGVSPSSPIQTTMLLSSPKSSSISALTSSPVIPTRPPRAPLSLQNISQTPVSPVLPSLPPVSTNEQVGPPLPVPVPPALPLVSPRPSVCLTPPSVYI